ncbi:LysR family transcriptional regulator [Candidimonas nitroreducens]|uniref:Transcriptional regulator n=1 Tax=Candidimonas nitroreducens TaxID=683354 RepID=A0A225M395_9BURK|nr:LysR family transcriptional regulator [Candidimonas nitroreducens]OWT55606.1 transcriptional regulator [Candidimonas nitroreducens]
MKYDLTTLAILLAVAEEKNLTRAARRRHLAVSAVSKRIKELEDQVGAPLLARYSRGVELTPAGQSMVFYARQLQAVLGQMENELADYGGGIKGHVRIHAITSAIAQFLPRDIARFVAAYPLIRFDIEERVGSAVVQAVCDGSADLGIFAQQTPAQGLEVFPYRRDELIALVGRGHALARKSRVTFDEIIEHEFVGPHVDSSVHTLLTTEAARRGRSLAFKIRISSFESMCQMVEAGLGLALMPRALAQPHLKGTGLKALTLNEPWARRDLLMGVRSLRDATPTVKALLDSLSGRGQAD